MSSDQSKIGSKVALEPIEGSDWPSDIEDMLTGFAGGLNVYRTMAHHPALLRASPHYYNTVEEIEHFVAELKQLL